MKRFKITLRTRASDTPGELYAIARELVLTLPNNASRIDAMEAGATAMGLNLDPETFRRTRRGGYSIADVAGSGGLSHLTTEAADPATHTNGRAFAAAHAAHAAHTAHAAMQRFAGSLEAASATLTNGRTS